MNLTVLQRMDPSVVRPCCVPCAMRCVLLPPPQLAVLSSPLLQRVDGGCLAPTSYPRRIAIRPRAELAPACVHAHWRAGACQRLRLWACVSLFARVLARML